MKRTPLRRDSAKNWATIQKNRKPLRKVSKKRAKEQRIRSSMIRELVKERGDRCEAPALAMINLIDRQDEHSETKVKSLSWGCNGWADDVHEPLTRGRGGSITDPENMILVCRSCHDWIHAHPLSASDFGLLRSD